MNSLPDWNIALIHRQNGKDAILGAYLERIGLRVFPIRSVSEFETLSKEREIHFIFLTSWAMQEKECRLLANEIKKKIENKQLLIAMVLVISEAETENKLLPHGQFVLKIPDAIFNAPSHQKTWTVQPHYLTLIREEILQTLIESSPRNSFESSFLTNIPQSREQLTQEKTELKEKAIGLVYESSIMSDIVHRCRKIGSTDATVLIQGESGTGKELIADLLHSYSVRKDRPILKINCAALSPQLVEAELFGYEKGAFTGASQQRKGYFEASHQGTLFLDEIGELEAAAQAKLLRVLEKGEFLRVGGIESVRVNVRIIAATNRDLKAFVQSGRFREDLYYRLNVVAISLPALRERPEDIPPLFNYFINFFNIKYGRSRNPISEISMEAKRALLNYPWPGNVRELRNCIERFAVLKEDHFIQYTDLPVEIQERGLQKISYQTVLQIQPGIPLIDYEREIIRRNLEYTSGNRKMCAEILQISERTLYRKIKEFGLEEIGLDES